MTFPGLPPLQSVEGHEVDRILTLIHGLVILLFVGWCVYFVVALLRGRASRAPNAAPLAPPRIAIPWFLVGIVFALEVTLFVGHELPAWSKLRSAVPSGPDVVRVRVVAEQFAWNVHLPGADGLFGRTDPTLVAVGNPVGLDTTSAGAADDIVAINEMQVPLDRTIVVELSSKDVIHSFALPVMRVKQDVIPGQMSRAWFTPTVADTTDIACAQLCGLGHYRMRGRLIVRPEAEWRDWVARGGR
jgi:cytochrome c oxidase subunit 2